MPAEHPGKMRRIDEAEAATDLGDCQPPLQGRFEHAGGERYACGHQQVAERLSASSECAMQGADGNAQAMRNALCATGAFRRVLSDAFLYLVAKLALLQRGWLHCAGHFADIERQQGADQR